MAEGIGSPLKPLLLPGGITVGHPDLLPPMSGMPGEWLSSCSERTQYPSATSQRREVVYFFGGSKDSF